VVGTRVSGLPLAIVPGETGWLVGEGDAAELAAAIAESLAAPARSRELGGSGRARVRAEFSWDAVAARYRAAYLVAIDQFRRS
jgi:glycosyltransferase involved in cell wall biosynthesis